MELTTEQRLETIKHAFVHELQEILQAERLRTLLTKEAVAGAAAKALTPWARAAPWARLGLPLAGAIGGGLVGGAVDHPWTGALAGASLGTLPLAGALGRSVGRLGSAEAAAERVLLDEAAKKGLKPLERAQTAVQRMRETAPLRPGLGLATMGAGGLGAGYLGTKAVGDAAGGLVDRVTGRSQGQGGGNALMNLALMGGGAYAGSQLPGLLGMENVPEWMKYLLPIAGGVTAPAMFGG